MVSRSCFKTALCLSMTIEHIICYDKKLMFISRKDRNMKENVRKALCPHTRKYYCYTTRMYYSLIKECLFKHTEFLLLLFFFFFFFLTYKFLHQNNT